MTIIKLLLMSLLIKVFALETSTADLISANINNKVVGLDVRSLVEVKTNPATGSLHIPLATLKDTINNKIPKGTEIFVFCEAGYRAEKAKKLLVNLGYKKVKNIKDWRTWNKVKKSSDRK